MQPRSISVSPAVAKCAHPILRSQSPPGSFVVHPPGEVHEYVNGPQRTLLFRVRIGDDMTSRHLANRGIEGWTQRPQDAAYFAANPPRVAG